jgi:hypothetical protein
MTGPRALRFGVGRATITPPAGLWLSGFGLRDGPMEGVHDDLYATAVVLDDGTRRVALVACDLVGFPAEVARRAREEIARQTGIPPEAVVLACSHTHSGGATGMVREPQDGVPAYVAALVLYIAGAVRMACQALGPGELRVARGTASLGINRRLPHDPPGPVDDSVTLLTLADAAHVTRATIVHCACHPVAFGHGNRLASADYVGFARQVVEAVTGAPLLFLQGACGDVNPRTGVEATAASAQRTGRLLAAEVLRLHELTEPAGEVTIGVAGRTLGLPLQPSPPRDEVARRVAEGEAALAALQAAGASRGRLNMALFPLDSDRDLLAALEAGRAQDPVPCEVQALRAGPVGLVALPVEPFAATGLAVRGAQSLPYSMVVGYANGCLGYLPVPEAYPFGGYEVATAHQFYRLPVPLAPDAEPLVRRAALELLQTLAAGA